MTNEKRLIPDGKQVTLDELEPGTIFAFGDDCFAVKSEYRCSNGLIEAFIIDSGEQFWGGAKTAKEQNSLMVQPLAIVEVVRCKDCKHSVNLNGELTCPYYDDYTVEDNHFCSYGERRAEGQ